MQQWLHMAGGHNKVEYCSGAHLEESGFRYTDLSLALAFSLGRGLRRTVASVTGQPLPNAGVVTHGRRPQQSGMLL